MEIFSWLCLSCWDNYITSDDSTQSRSGLYGTDLSGVTLSLFDDLTKDEQEDYAELWEYIYKKSKNNFINDVTGKMSDKFHVERKLMTRNTSQFDLTENIGSSLAGIKITYTLPKYAALTILTIDVFSLVDCDSPEFEINIYDTDEHGELLYTKNYAISKGRNSVPIDQDFETDSIYVTYSVPDYRLYKTENKFYANTRYFGWDKLSCSFPCWGSEYNASVIQVNGGGLDVHFNVTCSIERFICENLNIFKIAFWNRIGLEIMNERILSDRFNRFTTLTKERAEELKAYYKEEYDSQLMNSVRNLKIQEDTICFSCKSAVSARNILP